MRNAEGDQAMTREPAKGRANLSKAILKTLLYADIFDYPLTADEICRYLPELEVQREEVSAVLEEGLFADGLVHRHNGFFALRGRTHLAGVRERRSAIAQKKWQRARRFVRIIAHLPFVRMVAVTGALAVDNVEAQDDIDLLVVTAPGRLWLCRALVILVVYAARLFGERICPNYFLTDRALVLDDCNLFTARELAQMVPLYGSEIYYRMRALNAWTRNYLPQADGPPSEDGLRELGRTGRAIQGVLERMLSGRIGAALEAWEMRRKVARLTRQASAPLDPLVFSPDCCKGHFDGHGRIILDRFERRVREYGL